MPRPRPWQRRRRRGARPQVDAHTLGGGSAGTRTCVSLSVSLFLFWRNFSFSVNAGDREQARRAQSLPPPVCAHLREAAVGVDSELRRCGNPALDGNDAPRKGNTGMQSGDQQHCAAVDQRCTWDGVPSSQPRDQVREIFPRLVVFCC